MILGSKVAEDQRVNWKKGLPVIIRSTFRIILSEISFRYLAFKIFNIIWKPEITLPYNPDSVADKILPVS